MRHRFAAQALVWFTLALPMFVSIAGLAIDGGVLLASRRQLQSVADGAARAGATRLDLERLRSSGGADVQLDQALALEAASTYVDERLPRERACPAVPRPPVGVSQPRAPRVVPGAVAARVLGPGETRP